ncbi:anchored repeat ABC transporter, substrate-binding protein [Curtobacterium sp. RRHDQ66]|uniref:anchored repeat ABC transporter, substrate-binding protein n=1 Tax=Curtobacterium guangdongense TaxID=3413380 RepID=UPI003BF2BC9B
MTARRRRGGDPAWRRGASRRIGRLWAVTVATTAVAGLLAGCAPSGALSSTSDGRVRVVTTTGILADLVRNVGGDRVQVRSIVPDDADSHTYEPSLRNVRDVAYADLAFSNYLLLEEHDVIKALDANLRPDATEVSIAEASTKYASDVIPLVEDVSLDTIWLGLRVEGSGTGLGADRSSEVQLRATGLDGPGELTAYLTGTFGDTDVLFSPRDGDDRDDTATLPPDAHTHLSWAFTEPGVYALHLRASLRKDDSSGAVDLGTTTIRFAVGVDPSTVRGPTGAVLDSGHADITVDLDGDAGDRFSLRSERTGKDGSDEVRHDDPATAIVSVPNTALKPIPAGPGFRFLGRSGQQVYQLPQAVLGVHVHGSIDPHLWQDVRNAQAYVKVIRDSLAAKDPRHADDYRRNAARYLDTLTRLDDQVRATIAAIPTDRRHLVTTHDAFAYLAKAYGMRVSGFVTPNPASEPSLADRQRLAQTIRSLHIPAVFLEPNLAARSSTLTSVAAEQGVAVCRIYGDTFGPDVHSYVQMMRYNAHSLHDCLT